MNWMAQSAMKESLLFHFIMFPSLQGLNECSETIRVSLSPCHTEEYFQHHMVLNYVMNFACHIMPEG